jgi:hypothetical protein
MFKTPLGGLVVVMAFIFIFAAYYFSGANTSCETPKNQRNFVQNLVVEMRPLFVLLDKAEPCSSMTAK